MSKNKTKLIIGLVLISLFTSGCSVAKLSNGQDAAFKIGEDLISVDDLYTQMKNKYALGILLDMADEKILNKVYKETDDEKEYLASQIEQIEYYYKSYYRESYNSYEAFIYANYGVDTNDALKELFRLDYRRTEAIDDYVESIITDKEIQKYYDDKIVADIKASHILITADYKDGATSDEKAKAEEEALKKANEIIEKLKKGEDFAKLAKEHSKDGSASNGGDLGWFNKGEMTAEFEEAAFKLKKGAYTTTPVKTIYGYHIILKTDIAEKKKPLEEVKEEIIKDLSEEKKEKDTEIGNKALVKLREKHNLSIEDSELARQYKNYINNFKD